MSRLVVLPDPGVDEVGAALPGEVARQGEGAHDEAVGVHDVLRDRPVVGVPVLAYISQSELSIKIIPANRRPVYLNTCNIDPIGHILHTGHQQAAHLGSYFYSASEE